MSQPPTQPFSVHYLKSQLALLPQPRQWWLGLSGGLDSVVLLHALSQLAIPLKPLHIHHGLQANANAWADFCNQLCQTILGQTCQIHPLALTLKPGDSVEAVARTARYQAFASHLQAGDVLLTAHHQDDQAETVLLQLLRGAGVRGLAAMPSCQRLGSGWLARPLLGVSRQALAAYSTQHHLAWVEDDSNTQERFARNYLRHQIMPRLGQRWPQLSQVIARSAHHAAEAAALLDELAQQDLLALRTSAGLSVIQLQALSPARRRNALRYWIRSQGFPPPDQVHLQRIESELLPAGIDRNPLVAWQGVECRRYRGNLYLQAPLPAYNPQFTAEWPLAQPLLIPGIGTLSATLRPSDPSQPGLQAAYTQLTVKLRHGGESYQWKGYHWPLKKCWQHWGVPPWLRGRLPLLYADSQLAAVPSYGICQPFQAEPGEWAWHLQLLPLD